MSDHDPTRPPSTLAHVLERLEAKSLTLAHVLGAMEGAAVLAWAIAEDPSADDATRVDAAHAAMRLREDILFMRARRRPLGGGRHG